MKQTIIRYTVKADRASENEAYVTKVFAALARERPAHLRYATLKLEDGVSFVHLVSYESDEYDTLTDLDAFQDFLAGIKERCVEPPVSKHFTNVGAYRLFGG